MIKDEVNELLLLNLILGKDVSLAGGDPIAPTNWLCCVGNVGQHIIEVTVFSIDEAADFGELLVPVAAFGQSFQESSTGVGTAPELA